MTSNFWATNDLIDEADSGALAGTIEVGSRAPMPAAPAWAPLNEYSLKFLSFRVPMSVTTPIFRADVPAADGDAPPDGDSAGAEAEVVGCDGVVADCAGVGVAPPPQAATMMATAPNSVRPSERLCMCPPPASRLRVAELRKGPSRSRRNFATMGDLRRRILTRRGRSGKCSRRLPAGSVVRFVGMRLREE